MTKALFTIAATNVPQQLTGVTTPFNTAVFYGHKSFAPSGYPVGNVAPVYLGPETGKLPHVLATGGIHTITVPLNHKDTLSNWYIEGTANDGVYVIAY